MRAHLCTALLVIGCVQSTDGPAAPEPLIQTDTAPPAPEPTDTFPSFIGEVPQNILMISVDTWRLDHFVGSEPTQSPFLRSLADEGVRLADHTTCSNWTYAGTTCTLLGMYNLDNGFLPKLDADYTGPVPSGRMFLASYLVAPGYHNLLVSGNAWLGQLYNNSQGYHNSDYPWILKTDLLMEEGVRRLEAAVDPGTDKWFLHVHLMAPHAPYNPPEEYLAELEDLEDLPIDLTVHEDHYEATEAWPNMSLQQQDLLEAHLRLRYAAELRYLDDQLRDIFADLDTRGLLDDTLVVFWSDHGEAFWEHGYQTHAWTLHRQENEGIAFFWAKNIVPAVWEEPTVAIDIAPTILSVLGVGVPNEMTGIPVGEAPSDRFRFAYSIARSGAVQSVQQHGWKLIFNWSGELELYNIDSDPAEQNNLYSDDNPTAVALWEQLKPRIEASAPHAEEWTISWPEGLP